MSTSMCTYIIFMLSCAKYAVCSYMWIWANSYNDDNNSCVPFANKWRVANLYAMSFIALNSDFQGKWNAPFVTTAL